MKDYHRVWHTRHCASKRSQRVLASLAIGLCLGLLSTACTDNGGETGTQATKDSLAIAYTQEPTDWNYLRNPSTAIRALLMLNVLEPLLDKQEDGTLSPLLAESYKVSDDGLVYTFKLREAVFSDGSALTADDVVYSLEQARTTKLEDVAGPLKVVKQVAKTDDRTVTVTLSTQSQRFLEAMSADGGIVIPQGSANSLNKTPVGSGPFVFRTWKNGVQVDLDRNDRYWGERPALRAITWRFIEDTTVAINALRAGDVDLIGGFWSDKVQIDSVMATPGFAKNGIAGREIVYISLNADDPAFADARVRQAIAYSLDRQPLIDGVSGVGPPTCVLVNPPNVPWKSDKCPYPHNPAKAKQLLTEAGKQGLALRYTALAGTDEAVAIITQGLERAGFKVKTDYLDFPAYADRVFTKAQYQFTQIAGPQQIDAWTCPGFFTKDCYQEFDNLLARADRALDRTEWADLRREAVEKHAERAYLIPIYTSDATTLYRTGIAGHKPFSSNSEVDLRGLHWSAG